MASEEAHHAIQLGRIAAVFTKVLKHRQWARQIEEQIITTRATQRSKLMAMGFPPELVDQALDRLLSAEHIQNPSALSRAPQKAAEELMSGYRASKGYLGS